MIDWRGLLDELRIPWADKGRNTSVGNVSIACPWCGDDPSHHLSISERKNAWFCYRDDRHRGSNLAYLVSELCGSRSEAELLLAHYSDGVAPPRPAERPAIQGVRLAWQAFKPITESKTCLAYMQDRGFSAADCAAFDLRYAPGGTWAQRVLIPVLEDGELITWIGRSVRPSIVPKYLAQPIEHPGYVYMPREGRGTLILVEGAMDAMKLAAHTGRDILPVALLGKMATAGKLRRIAEAASRVKRIYLALDADTTSLESFRLARELAPLCRAPIQRLSLPDGIKDPGEMTPAQIYNFIESLN